MLASQQFNPNSLGHGPAIRGDRATNPRRWPTNAGKRELKPGGPCPTCGPDRVRSPRHHCRDRGAGHSPDHHAVPAPPRRRGPPRSWQTPGNRARARGRNCCAECRRIEVPLERLDDSDTHPFSGWCGTPACRARPDARAHWRTVPVRACRMQSIRCKRGVVCPCLPPVRHSSAKGKASMVSRPPGLTLQRLPLNASSASGTAR